MNWWLPLTPGQFDNVIDESKLKFPEESLCLGSVRNLPVLSPYVPPNDDMDKTAPANGESISIPPVTIIFSKGARLDWNPGGGPFSPSISFVTGSNVMTYYKSAGWPVEQWFMTIRHLARTWDRYAYKSPLE